MDLAHIPSEAVDVPSGLRAVVGAERAVPVWRNLLGGLTFAVGGPRSDQFAKWVPIAHASLLDAEAERLRWAGPFVAVPTILEEGVDDEGRWMVTAALPGTSAVSPRWTAAPQTAAAAIGAGLRAFHDAAPVPSCPFTVDLDERLAAARQRCDEPVDPRRLPPDLVRWSPADLRTVLDDPPDRRADDVVVGHGDGCAPNTIVGDDGRFVGHVDLGELGVTDRWADLAVASWSLAWNYDGDHEATFFAAYGTEPDADRLRFFRVLWALG